MGQPAEAKHVSSAAAMTAQAGAQGPLASGGGAGEEGRRTGSVPPLERRGRQARAAAPCEGVGEAAPARATESAGLRLAYPFGGGLGVRVRGLSGGGGRGQQLPH